MTKHRGKRALIALVAAAALLASASPARAEPPQILATWVTNVNDTGAKLNIELNPNGLDTGYRFEYVTEAAFQKSGFAGAALAPPDGKAGVGSEAVPKSYSQIIEKLTPGTAYRYRPVAFNEDGSTIGPERIFTTSEVSPPFELPDDRAWELVSPLDKHGGEIAPPGALFGGGSFQVAAGAATVTYSSATAFGEAKGAPPASQYVSRRTPSGWVAENISAPLESGAYGDEPDGVPYRLFSTDLGRGLLFGGLPCRGDLPGCPAPNPVLPDSGAPPSYMAYYLRDSASGAFTSLLTASDLAHTTVSPEAFEVSFAAASPDLAHVVLSTCAALTADATEVPDGPGKCDAEAQNLYERSPSGLRLINLLPGDIVGTPGAEIAASIGAVSADGSRIYWTQGGDLYLRQGSETIQVDESLGGGGTFEAASSDGGVAFFSKEGHLHRFLATSEPTEDLTAPAGGVAGVLGASQDGLRVYYQDGSGLKLWDEGITTTVAPDPSAAAPSNFPPATGTARVTPDGEHLAFLSTAELTGFDTAGQTEVFLYGPPLGGGEAKLVCASCNPTGERPEGSASIPGALVNGSTRAYKPRALSEDGHRLFFDSEAPLVTHDTSEQQDVYQWEANGSGDCARSPGCVKLISSGKSVEGPDLVVEGASFVDASSDGSDVYFLTDDSLLPIDPGSVDLYDARIGGGFPLPPKPIVCVADGCQPLPAPPDDPTPGTLLKKPGNPPLRYFKERRRHKKKAKRKRRGERSKSRGGPRGGRGR